MATNNQNNATDPTKVPAGQEQNVARQFKNTIREKKREEQMPEEESSQSYSDETPSPGIATSAPGAKFEKIGSLTKQMQQTAADQNAQRSKGPQSTQTNTNQTQEKQADPFAKQNFQPDPEAKPEAADLAKEMAGGGKPGAKTPSKPTAGDKNQFKAGGGKIPQGQYGTNKQDKPGNTAAGEQKSAQTANAVKRQMQSAKRAAAQAKAVAKAPGNFLKEAKNAAKQIIDDLNPLKKLQEIMKDVKKLIPILMRMLLEWAGLGQLLRNADRLIKKDNTDKVLTASACLSLAWNAWLACMPIIALIVIGGFIASALS